MRIPDRGVPTDTYPSSELIYRVPIEVQFNGPTIPSFQYPILNPILPAFPSTTFSKYYHSPIFTSPHLPTHSCIPFTARIPTRKRRPCTPKDGWKEDTTQDTFYKQGNTQYIYLFQVCEVVPIVCGSWWWSPIKEVSGDASL